MASPADWYNSLPPVCKAWGTAAFATTCAVQLRLLSPKLLYLDFGLVAKKFEIWRLVSTFVFIAPFSLKFLFSLVMLARYGVSLESNTFQARTADFVYLILLAMGAMLVAAFLMPFMHLYFLSGSLVFMLVYLWSRENANASVSIMGLLTIQGFYLPWAYLFLDLITGANIWEDILGILVGHLYYYLTVLHPLQGGSNLLATPLWLHQQVMKWGIIEPGSHQAAPVYRPGGAAAAAAAVAPPRAAAGPQSGAFRGRAYRLDRD